MKKRCFKCKKIKDINQFYTHPQMADGHLGKCKVCNKKDVKNNYRAHIDRYREYERNRFKDPKRKIYVIKQAKKRKSKYPGKERARRNLLYAVKNGKIRRPKICEKCKLEKCVQGHHVDYRRPLFVKWLCFRCHRQEHGQSPA